MAPLGRAPCSAVPAPIALAGFVVLIAIALPMFCAPTRERRREQRRGESTTTHKAYDLIANGFGPGANGPILVVIDTTKPTAQRRTCRS